MKGRHNIPSPRIVAEFQQDIRNRILLGRSFLIAFTSRSDFLKLPILRKIILNLFYGLAFQDRPGNGEMICRIARTDTRNG